MGRSSDCRLTHERGTSISRWLGRSSVCLIILAPLVMTFSERMTAQDSIVHDLLLRQPPPAIAIPELRGSGSAESVMKAFNATLWSEVARSGSYRIVPKSFYPLHTPQQPSDFNELRARRGSRTYDGLSVPDWSSPPTSAKYLLIGYAASQDRLLILNVWLCDVTREDPKQAQVFTKRYWGRLDERAAQDLALRLAADVIRFVGPNPVPPYDPGRVGHDSTPPAR